jgi:hypothetical protein
MILLRVAAALTSWQLGTIPYKEKARTFVAAKAPDIATSDEEASLTVVDNFDVDEELQKMTTGFWRLTDDVDQIVIYDYMFKGFLKEAGWAMKRAKGSVTKDLKAYIKAITGCVFVEPRLIKYTLPEGAQVEKVIRCTRSYPEGGGETVSEVVDPVTVEVVKDQLQFKERPLRAQTPKGERTCLARSEQVPPGTTFELMLRILDNSMLPVVIELLQYGELKGLGQWRSGGFGSFKILDLTAVKSDVPFDKKLKVKFVESFA